MFTPEEKRELLAIARAAIGDALKATPFQRHGRPRGALAQPCGAFVTLRLDGDLRGCIGYIESSEPLADVVASVAVKAAFEDPRFPPLSPAEFGRVSVEISVLSPLRPVTDINEIEVGVHGLLLELGVNRGLLLPQVATEYGWGRIEFLANLARKAGLPRNSWSDPGARLFAFTADIIEEEQPVA